MPKDYQKQKSNPYLLPKTVYHRTLWVIRDYERMKAERNEILYSYSCEQDGMPHGSDVGNPTEVKALKLEQISKDMEAVEQALLTVDDDMRNGIINNICYQVPYPYYPSLSTWIRRKRKFMHDVAQNLKLV